MAESPCPKGDGCALNDGAIHCFHCGRNWPPDHTWKPVARKVTKVGLVVGDDGRLVRFAR